VILETSAIVAILRDEPEAADFTQAIEDADSVSVSAATVVEAHLVLGHARRTDLDALLARSFARVHPVTADHAEHARRAHDRYGRGSGSRARLNFGDCFSYALAKATGEPLLFKGDDFGHTDITPAR